MVLANAVKTASRLEILEEMNSVFPDILKANTARD
jgi:hypothetical protein